MTRIVNSLLFVFLLVGVVPAVAIAADKSAEKPATEAAHEKKGTEKKDTEEGEGSAAKKDVDAKQEADAADAGEAKADEAKADDKAEQKDAKKDAGKDDEDKKETPKKKERKTATVEKQRIKVDVTVDATFVAREMTEVMLEPKSWSTFKIEEIVEHGAKVNQGDVLIKFDREPLDEAIADLDLSLRVGEIALARAEAELPRLEKTLDMQLEATERFSEYAKQDLEDYKEKGRDQQLLNMDLSLKQFRMNYESAREELEQLEKMYQADDLTEETEEIVLKRQRQMVELYEAFEKIVEYGDERSRNVFLPRSDVRREESLKQMEMSLARARQSHKLDLNAARYSLEKQRKSREKSLDKHAKLIEDRGLMTLKAPTSGIVYYGRNVKGKWADLSSMLTKLKPKKSASKNQVLMTIVDPSVLYLAGTVSEKQLPSLAEGQSALVRPTAEGADPLRAAVANVSDLPVAAGKYAVEVELKTDDLPDWLDPGMTGKVKVTTYDKKDALVVSKKAVHTDEFDETVKYVWLVKKTEEDDAGEDDSDDEDESDDDADEDDADEDDDEGEEDEAEEQIEKRIVRLGKTKGDRVEIIDGLAEGDVVSLEDESKKDDE